MPAIGGIHTLVSYQEYGAADSLYFGAGYSGGTEMLFLVVNDSGLLLPYDIETIFDGTLHTLTATWDNASGDWEIFLDGSSVTSGTGLETGQTVGTNGQLFIGADMNTSAGMTTPDPFNSFKGTLHDVRIFDHVRTDREIDTFYRSSVPYNTSGLLANWQFNQLSADQRIVDTVKGNNLTVTSIAAPSFSFTDPELLLSVREDALNGVAVGSVLGTDAERDALVAKLTQPADMFYNAETHRFYQMVSSVDTFLNAEGAATCLLYTSPSPRDS